MRRHSKEISFKKEKKNEGIKGFMDEATERYTGNTAVCKYIDNVFRVTESVYFSRINVGHQR